MTDGLAPAPVEVELTVGAVGGRVAQPADAPAAGGAGTHDVDDDPAGEVRSQAAYRLALAAEAMDEAAVHTIDAWCQRMLREHAFDSGSLFDEELVADEEAMRTEAAQDYWRQQCYSLDAQALTQVLGIWPGVDALVADMRALQNQSVPASAGAGTLGEVLQQALQARQQAMPADDEPVRMAGPWRRALERG